MAHIITGEKLQELCDIFMGLPEDFLFNPRISKQLHKCVTITNMSKDWSNPQIIFCYGHRLNDFLNVMKYMKNPFILVSHNSDENITIRYSNILEHPKLVYWYAQNVLMEHEKLTTLPIGIANSMWPHGNLTIIENIIKSQNTKQNDFYFYFNINTNRTVRSICKEKLEKKGLLFDQHPLSFENYLQKLSQYKYAICPPGNGIDCHRLWECLYLGVIPILLRSIFSEKISKSFQVVLLDDWDDFNAQELLEKYTKPNYNIVSFENINLNELKPIV